MQGKVFERDKRYRRVASRPILWFMALALAMVAISCRRQSNETREATITVYGFSVVKEPLENRIFPDYQRQWKEKTRQELTFIPSYAGSEIVTNQIISGVEADVAILAIERNADRLVESKATKHNWRQLPYHGIVNKTPMVILVRKGNPLRIRDYSDLGQKGLRLIHCDPISSGAGQWSLLAVYGAELIKSERQDGVRDPEKALATLRAVWKNVISTPGSAREARTQFERKEGDALITYELEALQLMEKSPDYEMIVPPATVFSEHPVVIINHEQHGMSPEKYAIVELFVKSLWERPAQEAWVKANFRAVIDEDLNVKFVKIQIPFYVSDLGGWRQAYSQIIEGVWKQQVQTRK